jgi:hypothetical protein
MTKTVSISEAQSQLQGLLALTRNGDEVCRYEDVFAFELYLNT